MRVLVVAVVVVAAVVGFVGFVAGSGFVVVDSDSDFAGFAVVVVGFAVVVVGCWVAGRLVGCFVVVVVVAAAFGGVRVKGCNVRWSRRGG